MSSSHLKLCLYIDPVLNMLYTGYRELIKLIGQLHWYDPCTFHRLQILAPITTTLMYSTGLLKEQTARSFVNALL